MSFLVVVALIGLLGVCQGQVIQAGQCDLTIPVQDNFDINNFLGTWYEISRIPNDYQNGDCSTINFAGGDGSLTIYNPSYNRNFLEELNTTATYALNDPAKLSVTISASVEAVITVTNSVDHWILSTDYENYALTYSCVNIDDENREIYLWKLSRQSEYPDEQIPELLDETIASLFNIQANVTLVDVDHSEEACYALPIIPAGQPILLDGQCDDNIPVEQNFDPVRFVGIWHEISSYYFESGLGACNNALYSLNEDGSIGIVESQVLNETLEELSGVAVISSDDGSAVFQISLDMVFADQELKIIATDYVSYAIHYACTNVNNEQKRVFSWITSRTKQLSPATEAEVNAVIDSILDLNFAYYTPSDQSEEACFYYPEPIADQPVIFPGTCNLNIPAVANFDPEAYSGLWYEVEGYPSVSQEGTCNNAVYTLVDGVVDIYSTQVINQTLNEIYGIATVASDDGSAKLEVTYTAGGSTDILESLSYWVLATDYTSYSLAYTCQDLGNGQRAVWSWKLSRSKSLTPEAATAINNVIGTVQVLDERYYQAKDQSIDGCFYYPTPVPSQEVVFPGSCDDTIAAVANFNLENFQGTWYEIEAYPTDMQLGQCVSQEYSSLTDNSLSLISSQIIDGDTLIISEATVQLSSTDGSGRLTITVDTNGTVITFPFWILATDYTDYALAYSCVDLNNDFRGVWSWKLSRTRQISAAANTAINAAIEPIVVLDNVYYETIDHSEEACFYLPDISPGEPVVLFGQCDPNVNVVQNFDPARYVGQWYHIESYYDPDQSGECNDARYTLTPEGFVDVFNTQVINQTLDTINGVATVATTDGRGILDVTLPNSNEDGTVSFDSQLYYILDTDYDNYALVISCTNVDSETRRIYSWKLSRTRQLSDESQEAINNVITQVDFLSNRYYIVRDHSDEACFYYPDFVEGQAVTFRGQCDENIPVVQNFELDRYVGLWNDVSSYPQAFQFGACPTATYTPNPAGWVDVYNTQVIGLTLDGIEGIAVVDSDDESAKLLVTFPVAGTNATIDLSYYILATDYDSYSLVYSCTNLNSETRRVTSWKLSRQKTLTDSANTAINNVINTVDVLDERYYVDQDHSVEACFYLPEPVSGQQVEFPGNCDDTIETVIEFDMERFAGVWNEISAYPNDIQTGQCATYEFTYQSNLSFELLTTEVVNSQLQLTNSTLVRASTDNARFTTTLNVNGAEVTIPYWIIDTDYDNYALAYSCVNYENSRGVFAWKLSRTKELTDSSETAITQAISPIDVLEERYFESTDLVDGCFYLPQLSLNEPVLLAGQCDESIPAVANFDPARYIGQWYVIESYYDENQLGECNDALYSLTLEGTIDVWNTQVINQTLFTQAGTAVMTNFDGTGKLEVTFPIIAPDSSVSNEVALYWILDTDYNNYSFVYSCRNVDAFSQRIFSRKLSRTKTLSEESRIAIDATIDQINVLTNDYYITNDHSEDTCFYFPELIDGEAVTFRGQCDENIAVVQNFDIARYLGFWYHVGNYPQGFQSGSCPTATYTINEAGSVDVYNSQVINQTLDYIYGIAVVDSEDVNGIAVVDGSAKLTVTFTITGTNLTIDLPYYVLATDYDSYSLVYSCVNVDSERRRVTSWKLSRQTTLTDAANTVIDNIINTVDVLDDRYYVDQDHSAEACFYLPEPVSGQQVEFPGVCDDTIETVTDFDMERFAGVWNEISAYPNDIQIGQCATYEFTYQANLSFELLTTEVVNSQLQLTNGTLVRASTDNARFTATLNVDGAEITIPYWIIDTDYDNYALAYSCVNYENSRGVFAWKLSRTKEFTDLSETAITQAMSPIDVVEERYFESTDLVDGCFYLPPLSLDEPVILAGQCDQSIPAVANFDPARYIGQWYVIENYYDENQLGECNDALYSLTLEGTIDVWNTQVINETLSAQAGTAVMTNFDGTGKLEVTFPIIAPDSSLSIEVVSYWILDTDYDNYSFVYSCRNVDAFSRRVFSRKLSRTKTLSEESRVAIDATIDQINVLNNDYYVIRDHSEDACFYYPELTDGEAVTFRGQCDENIAVVQNFDIDRYLGFWYDVGNYPLGFQSGSCPTATYTLNEAGSVDMYYIQVINQTLDYIYGIAVVDTEDVNGIAVADGSAKLTVTFPIAGTNLTIDLPYYVLATDYDSYSLVYSCVNVDSERRRVSSWKLSRQPTLTNAATTAIDAVIGTVQVLDERYYQPQSHSADSCFYYPEPSAGTPVVFPGTCDDTVQAVPNFDFELFGGVWYEITTYPINDQVGQCVNYDFSVASTNALSLISTQIINGSLDVTNASLLQTSTDGSGRFTVTLNVGGNEIVIPYWIVATDYNSYALAYSCVNYENEQRGVWSWKLSRSKTLSAQANTAIDEVISSIEVLDNRYYETTDQSNDACFYLPELSLNEPVILPGQCDEFIPVIQNFDPTRYAGRWFDIESYYDQFQEGTCIDALYTLTPEGIVDVYNTQVVDGTLDTINGTAVLATTDGSGKLSVTFPVNGSELLISAAYWILDTDYDNYSFVYSCYNINEEQRRVFSWKLSRTRQLSEESRAAIDSIKNEIDVLNDQYYIVRDHSEDGCFYFPDLEPSESLIFRGQCNASVQAQQNFDIERYMGLWYDVGSYPDPQFQFGTCPTATYTLNPEGLVEVYNTQVVNQQFQEINGVAIVASTDGSAQLTVTFPVSGTGLTTNSPYWVLSTDYDNYALVYSCENIGEESYRVTSSKLSRETSLNAASTAAINQVVDSVRVLDDRYYIESSNSEEDCFYYPENNGGPVLLSGVCQVPDVVANFDSNRFAGTWYEVSRYPSELQSGDCSASEYSVNNNFLTLTYTIVYQEELTTITGTATFSADGSGTLSATFTYPDGSQLTLPLYILDTDYDNYALLSSCRSVDTTGQIKQVFSWKLSRSRAGLSDAFNQNIDAIVSSNIDLFELYYETTDQSNEACFYYPEYDESATAIILPGVCDESIQGIPNFSIPDYTGLWYEMEKYPVPSQDGQCARSEYSLQGNVVDILNTLVYNQTLEEQRGTAAVVSTDGSAVFNVTLVLSDGVVINANYYVLATDYNNYALVYSCRNLADGTRQVSSWKLSRSRTWNNQYEGIFEPIIENIQGLRQSYYRPISQSDEDCFYIPPAVEGQAAVFRGQCADITGVQGFDVQSFLGWWHEIEAYPTATDTGVCLSSRFQANGNAYQAVDTNVFGLESTVTTSTLEVTSDGRLRRINNGQVSDVWILATDYETYSLLYSCENVDGEFRSVWSAKYSKARTLSQASQNALQSIIDSIDVLVPEFYLPTDQSDEACFHYPTQSGQRIIIPGQCDQNIPVVQNFDAVAYTGTWYHVERYRQNWESGTCVGSKYTLDETTGIVTLVNWEVIDGELDTIEGTAVVTSSDGRLLVTEETTTYELFVLSTDYTTYSLAYSCENVNEFERAIGAWKLSRTRTMPTSGSAVINQVIQQRAELHQPYFDVISQYEECPEPSSAILVRNSVIVLLICSLLQRLF